VYRLHSPGRYNRLRPQNQGATICSTHCGSVLRNTTRRVCLTLFVSSGCVGYKNEGNKLPSKQLLSVIPLIWQYVSTSEGPLQASSIKYIKELCTIVLSFELKSQFYSFRKYILPCQISYVQEKVKSLKWLNDC
jgi:hypothetical protein